MASPLDSLDDAWEAWLDGRAEDAIQRCVGILDADAAQDPTAALLVHVLAAEQRDVQEAASDLVDVFIDRGDLPRAVTMAKVAGEGLDRVAAAFGKTSGRASNVPPAPPPLPPAGVRGATEAGDALSERAMAVLGRRARASGSGFVPVLPLFGDLNPEALEQLLEAFEVRSLGPGEAIITEGDEGTEAFVLVRGHVQVERGVGDDRAVLAELGPGAIFGEMALVSGAPRAASALAMESVQLLVGSVKRLEALASETPKIGRQLSEFCRVRMISNLVRHSRILGSVDAHEREALMARFESLTFEAGDALVSRDAETSGLFLIASGQVRVMGIDADGDELVVAELGPGDVVGEIGLVLRRPATADVIATHHTVALRLTREQFQEAIREHPALLGELYELASERDEVMRTVVAQETLDVEDVVLL